MNIRPIAVIDCRDKRIAIRESEPGPFQGGELLCQRMIEEDPGCLVLASGTLPFFPGNKLTVGYVSPLTGLPHYSFVGGRAAEHVIALGLSAVVLKSPHASMPEFYITLEGRAPDVRIRFENAARLPRGQRSSLYWLLAHELDSNWNAGSVLTLGDAAYHGYRSANIAVDGIYHAGRGGSGNILARMARAVVLKGDPYDPSEIMGTAEFRNIRKSIDREISPLLDRYCGRLGRPDTGTIVKMADTGNRKDGKNTMPSHNAMKMGYSAAGLGDAKTLLATRDGAAGCTWCEVRCRHWHWVKADYSPTGRDAYLDDFEPAYSLCAMLDLPAPGEGLDGLIALHREVDEKLSVPVEQLGIDVMDAGIAIAALFEGLETGIVPKNDVPEFLRNRSSLFGDIELASAVMNALRHGGASPAITAIGHGPQGLVDRYPAMKDIVFTCGSRTLGNAGHCNALWTFAMPLSRFFSHYSGQTYKIDESLPPGATDDQARKVFSRVMARMHKREMVSVLCNCLSMCAFVFNIFTRDGKGEEIDHELLGKVLDLYGSGMSPEDIEKWAGDFIAHSNDLRRQMGWRPPGAADVPRRIFEAVSQVMDQTPERCMELFDIMIEEWESSRKE